MTRATVTFAVLVLAALALGRLVLDLAGGILGFALSLAWLGAKVLAGGLLLYVVIAVFSPDTARRMREKVFGSPSA